MHKPIYTIQIVCTSTLRIIMRRRFIFHLTCILCLYQHDLLKEAIDVKNKWLHEKSQLPILSTVGPIKTSMMLSVNIFLMMRVDA